MSTNPLDELVRLSEEMGLYDANQPLRATPEIRQWIENVRGRALAGIPPDVIERVVTAWELYRRTMEAGEGIEPPTTGV